ncbi:MAG: serine hydrolase [Bacteroidia bacterium]|nr:serine hydrolase [Bacteroidia bacterium]
MKKLLLLITISISQLVSAQTLYFPPTFAQNWDTVSPKTLGWCVERIDSLYQLLEDKNTKGFMVLKDGKIVLEKYFGTFTKDSQWYWASAGKTITAALIGIAQQKGMLSINDSFSKYLGKGWSVCPPEKEGNITIKNHLTMTTGIDYLVPDWDCTEPSCLKYRADAGTQWFYHNATYLLLQNIIESASGQTLQQFTTQQLGLQTGITGLWLDGVFYSRLRSMARFGLLMLNEGNWNGTPILSDAVYFKQMTTPSQQLNQSYGYLWWLNGQPSFRLPGSLRVFNGSYCPTAPNDMIAGLGKNDQKIYVVPSQKLVVVRMGDKANTDELVPIAFDSLIWKELSRIICNPATGLNDHTLGSAIDGLTIFPNPNQGRFTIKLPNNMHHKPVKWYLINNVGQQLIGSTHENSNSEIQIDGGHLRPGLYTLCVLQGDKSFYQKVLINE